MRPALLRVVFIFVVCMTGLLVAGCCSTDRCRAITSANLLHDAGAAAAEAITHACTDKYHASQSLAEVAALDKPCIPVSTAYAGFRKALAVLVTKLAAGETAVGATLAAVEEAASVLSQKLGDL